jgi:hypothetical protein
VNAIEGSDIVSVNIEKLLPETVFLWDMEGTDGVSPAGDTDLTGLHTLSVSGSPVYSTTSPIYGTSSVIADGTSNANIGTGTSSLLNLSGVDKFTIEGSFLITSHSGVLALLRLTTNTIGFPALAPYIQLIVTSNLALSLNVDNGSDSDSVATSSSFLSVGTKYDYMISKEGDNYYLLVDGSLIGSFNLSGNLDFVSNPRLQLGLSDFPGVTEVKQDSLRFIKNEALHTANYTPKNAQLGFYGYEFLHEFEGIVDDPITLTDETGKALTTILGFPEYKGSSPSAPQGSTYLASGDAIVDSAFKTTNAYNSFNFGSEPFTISAYVYVEEGIAGAGNSSAIIRVFDDTADGIGPYLHFDAATTTSQYTLTYKWNHDDATPEPEIVSSNLDRDTWYKVTYGFDGTNMRMFIDTNDQGTNAGARLSQSGAQKLEVVSFKDTGLVYMDEIKVFVGDFNQNL